MSHLIDGWSHKEIAEAEGLSVRRVQRIVAEEVARGDADPAQRHALSRIARLEKALELLGRKIDEGKAAAIPAYPRVIEHLSKLARDQLQLADPPFREKGEAAAVEARLEGLSIARDALRERGPAWAEKHAKQNASRTPENRQNREIADFAPL